MNACQLPIEVCERIIDFSGLDPDDQDLLVDYPTLKACSLVCWAWVPRTRRNLFYRVVLRTTQSLSGFLAVAAKTELRVRELELGLPLDMAAAQSTTDASEDNASIVTPALGKAVRGVQVLTLSHTEWLYPRMYIHILGSYCASIVKLDLFHVYFSTGADLARLLWSFPLLCELECTTVIAKFGGLQQLPRPPSRKYIPCGALDKLTLNACSTTTPFILKAAVMSTPAVTDLFVLSSFATWRAEDFLPFAALVHLKKLVVRMASPTSFSPLAKHDSLVGMYARVTRLILSNLASAVQGRGTDARPPLRKVTISYEPAYGTRQVLSGQSELPQRSLEAGLEDAKRRASEDQREHWGYGQSRTVAVETFFGTLESELADDGKARYAFSRLRSLKVQVWDTTFGRDDAWWHREATRRVPTLYFAGVFRLEVVRGWSQDMYAMLWDPEGSEQPERMDDGLRSSVCSVNSARMTSM